MAEKKGEHPLKELLEKINHPLVEVRCRSLRSIMFKLRNNLLSILDLVHERAFLAHLLEWFNFDEWAMESQALSLIAQLAQHEAAAKTLVEIGGVEFLSQLRLHCDSSLHLSIDEALDHMFKLPPSSTVSSSQTMTATSFDESGSSTTKPPDDSPRVPAHNTTALSSESHTTFSSTGSTTDFGSYPQITRESFGLHSTLMDSPSLNHVLPQQYLHKFGTNPTTTSVPSSDDCVPHSHTVSSAMMRPGMGEDDNWWDVVGSANLKIAYTASNTAGVPDEPGFPTVEAPPLNKAVGGVNGLFQWIRITKNDSHILSTTQSRFQNYTPESLLTSCEFIQDVLFQDFPAHLFLQRPVLINCLLKSLEESNNGSSEFYPVLNCLLKFTELLHLQVAQRKSPPLLHTDTFSVSGEELLYGSTTEDDHLATSTPPKVRGDLELLTLEVLKHLQSQQLSVRHYCLSVVTIMSTLLSYCLHHDSLHLQGGGGARSDSNTTPIAVCVAKCLQLLTSVIDLLSLVGGDDRGVSENESVQLLASIESLCSVLSHCLSKWRRLATQAKQPTSQLQMVCCVTVSLTHCLSKLLPLLQHSKTTQTELGCLSGVLNGLMMNGVLCVTQSHLLENLLPFFQTTDTANSRVYLKVKEMAASFAKMSMFLVAVSSSSSPGETMINLANEGMLGLWFACNERFISEAMNVCFKVASIGVSVTAADWTTAKSLLLKLLNHGSTAVREVVYTQLQLLLSEHLPPSVHQRSPVKEAESSSSPHPTPLPIIVDPDVIHSLCASGALSDSETISSSACHVLSELLALKNCHFWPELRVILLQWMPFLELAMSHSEQLCKTMQSWLNSTEQDTCLPELVRLQCFIRLLFSENTQLRVWVYTQLSKLIISHSDLGEDHHPFPFPTQSVISLHDVLTAGRSHKDHTLKRNGSFQYEDVAKLMHILKSPTLDISLKKSAMEQLSLVLRDRLLHEQALEEGIVEHLVVVLKTQEMVSQQETGQGESSLLVKHSVVCLLLLLSSSPEERKKLSGNYELLMSLVKVAIRSHKDLESLYCLSKLLFLLLFCSAGVLVEDETIQAPNPLIMSLRLPFPVKGYNLDLNHETDCCMDPNLFTSDPLLSMLRLHYNVALAGGVYGLLSSQEKPHQLSPKVEDGEPRLLKCDVLGLQCFSVNMRLGHCLQQLKEATSHGDVVKLLQDTEVVFHGSYSQQTRSVVDSVSDVQWKEAIVRFLTVQPSTLKDIELLDSVLKFLSNTLLKSSNRTRVSRSDASCNHLLWLAEATCGRDAVCLNLLHSSMQHNQSSPAHRTLQKTLMWFYAALMEALVSQSDYNISEVCDSLTILQILQQCLDIAGSPGYYDLPLLESTLECLIHLTASKAMCSTPSIGLLMKLLSSLRQVMWSFLSGQGSKAQSFMGKGVTSRAALSMCHLIQTTRSLQPPEEWWLKWLHSSSHTEKQWLYALLEDRDIKVRYAGFSLLATLCTTLNVATEILSDWSSSSPFGLWGTCMNVCRDNNECSLIKQQALMVLVSLSGLCNRQKKWNTLLVYDCNEVSLKGRDALKSLLSFYDFLPTLLRVINPKHQLSTSGVSLITSLKQTSSSPANPKSSSTNQQENDSESLSLEDSVVSRGIDYRRLFEFCDPYVVSGVCSLLHNVFLASPELIEIHTHGVNWVESLTMVLDPSVLQIVFAKSTRVVRSCWVKMCVDVLTLLNTIVQLQPDSALPHVLKQKVVEGLCHHLSIVRVFSNNRKDTECLEMCSRVLSLLQTLVMRASFSKAELVLSCLQLHWDSFIDLLIDSLSNEISSSLKKHALTLFCSLLVHRFQKPTREESGSTTAECEARVDTLKHMLDVEPEPQSTGGTEIYDDQTEKSSPFGSVICNALLRAYDQSMSFSEEKRQIGEVLGLLLACSSSAKETALESGLLESSLNLMKMLHAKLCMENLERKKKQDSSILSELISNIGLVRNFMYKSSTIKSACVRCHLAVVISDMWPVCTVNKRLLLAVLRMLSVLSAQHSEGRASLACASKGGVCLLQKVLKLTSQTVSSYKNCTASKISNPHSEVLGALFTLLSNCAVSQECRAIIKKTGFLLSFTTLCPSSEKPSSKCATTRLSVLWIKLLTNLSFSSEGQQMFFKQPGSLEVLLDVYQYASDETQTSCLMVLRNLCFYGPAKTLMASNEKFLVVLSSALDSERKQHTALAASAVWSLLYNCVKIKNVLKKSELSSKLQAITSSLIPGLSCSEEEGDVRYRQALIKAQELLSS